VLNKFNIHGLPKLIERLEFMAGSLTLALSRDVTKPVSIWSLLPISS
jgi:hypothetical protein